MRSPPLCTRHPPHTPLVFYTTRLVSNPNLAKEIQLKPKKTLCSPNLLPYLGGNCYDFINKHGFRVSQYGVHLFHTKFDRVWRGCTSSRIQLTHSA
jgi:hypothetical protein